MTDCIVMPL